MWWRCGCTRYRRDSLIGGVLADSVDRRKLMMVAQVMSAILAIGLALNAIFLVDLKAMIFRAPRRRSRNSGRFGGTEATVGLLYAEPGSPGPGSVLGRAVWRAWRDCPPSSRGCRSSRIGSARTRSRPFERAGQLFET